MDHNEAIKLRAAERYALGELPEEVRDAYEEHFFECAECAMDMQTVSAFVDGAREIFGEEAKGLVREAAPEVAGVKPSRELLQGWWKGWQTLIAVPAFAVLVLVVGYGVWRTSLKARPMAGVAGQSAIAEAMRPTVWLLGDTRKAQGEAPAVRVRQGEAFTMDFDFTPSRKFGAYVGQLQDAAGRAVLPVTLSGEMVNREVHVLVPAGIVHAGKYRLVFAGVAAARGASAKENPVESFAFSVEIIP